MESGAWSRRSSPRAWCWSELAEFDWSPYDIFPDMEEVAPGKFRMRRFGRNLPMVYSLVARRPG
jgi:hypothetical protein